MPGGLSSIDRHSWPWGTSNRTTGAFGLPDISSKHSQKRPPHTGFICLTKHIGVDLVVGLSSELD